MQIFKKFIEKHSAPQVAFLRQFFQAPTFKPLFEFKEASIRSHGGVRVRRSVVPIVIVSDSYLTKKYREGEYKIKFTEYHFIAQRSDIGSFVGTWQQYLLSLLAHEIAHSFVLWCIATSRVIEVPISFRATMPPPGDYHMEDWQYVYSLLRKTFVAPTFKQQKELEELFRIA